MEVITAMKGAGCSKAGRLYEHIIHDIVSKCIIANTDTSTDTSTDADAYAYKETLFNTQLKSSLGGCSAGNDLECNFKGDRDIPIEIKKKNTPDWMQLKLVYNSDLKTWTGCPNPKIPLAAKTLFEKLLLDVTGGGKAIFNGEIPPFLLRNITHTEWLAVKKESNAFKDMYFECPSDTILQLYREKGCKYIQISDKGLYHLGEDSCNFQVPEFICDQELRLRTKIHTRANAAGFCSLSVTIACKPKKINTLPPSSYSLDCVEKLPVSLIYKKEMVYTVVASDNAASDNAASDNVDMLADALNATLSLI